MQTKTLAMILLIIIATVGAMGIGIGTQSAQGQNACGGGFHGNPDDTGHGQSFHDCKGDVHSGHA